MSTNTIAVSSSSTVNSITVTNSSAISVITAGTQGVAGPNTILGRDVGDSTASTAGSLLVYDHSNTQWIDSQVSAAQSLTAKLYNLQFTTGGATVTQILDEDNLGSNSNTALATQQSIKAYVDAELTSQDLDFQGDSGGALSIDLDSETMTIAGGTGLASVGSGNTVTLNIDSTVTTLTGTQTLTNKTLTAPVLNTVDINGGDISSDTTINKSPQITLAGDLSGSVTLTSLGNGTLTATIAANSVALGTDTTGNYVATISAGEGIDVSGSGSETAGVTISAEDATDSNKGIASFDATDFTVSSGDVTVNAERIQDIVGAMVSSNTESGIAVAYQDSDGTLDFDVGDFDIALTGDVTGTGTVTNLGNVSISTTVAANSVALGTDTTGNYVATLAAANSGIDVANSGSETAGVTVGLNTEYVQDIVGAMFSSNTETGIAATYEDSDGTIDLIIGSGVITNAMLAGSIANSNLANSSITVTDGSNSTATALGGTITFSAGEGIDVAESSGTITVSGEDASSSNKGVASFDSTDFSVSSGAVSLQAERVQDIVGAMVSSNTESGIAVSYEDSDGTLDFNVNDPTLTFTGEVTGSGTMTNLGNTSIALTLAADSVGTSEIADDAVTNAKIADNAVTLGTQSTGNYVATIAGTANEITVTGSGSETAAVTIALPDDVTIGNDLTVTGDLTVNGTTTTVNTTNLDIEDATLRFAKNASSLSATNGAGLEFGASTSKPTILWDNSNSFLTSNKTFNVGGANGTSISVGAISLKNAGTQSRVDFYCESSNAHYARLQAPAHSAFSGNVTLTLPASTGSLVGTGDTGTVTNTMLAGSIANSKLSNSTVSFGGISVALGASDSTPAFDLSDATNYPTSSLSGTITNAQLAGSIANSKLANSTVSFGGISLALGASDATPAFDLTDATNYPTSSLTGTITNAQLAGSIANGKLANSTVSFGGISLALGASDATPAFDLSDATNYPTSSLSGTITNAQLAGSIANAKLANSSITVSDGSNSTATALGGTITFAAGEGIDVAESSGTVTFSAEDATSSNKGVASFTGDFSVSSGAVSLGTSGVSAASYGSSTAIPVITVDAKGRITSASTASINTSFTLSDGSNTQTVSGGDTLTVAGTSNEVNVAVSATDTLTIGLPNDVTIGNNLVVSGNLSVTGTTTQTGSVVTDNNFTGLTNANTGNSTDFGFHGKYVESSTTKYAGLFYDASTDNTFRLFADTQTVPSTTVNTGATGYTAANLVIGALTASSITLGGTAITSTAAEINILDGVTATASELNITDGLTATTAELNIMDGGTSATSTTLADADRVVVNDNGTMKQVALTDFETYFESAIDTLALTGDFSVNTNTLKVDTSNNRVGIKNASPDVGLDAGSVTDAFHVPVGTTAQRPTGAAGYFRYNSTLGRFEGYTDAWGEIGGGGSNTFSVNTYTANGSTDAFTLSQTPSSEDNLFVFVEGVFMNPNDYTLNGTTLTLDAAPPNGRKIVVYSVRAAVSGNNLNHDQFTCNGNSSGNLGTEFTLTISPISENNTQVFLDGVYQQKTDYSVSGTTLTMDTAPASGAILEVMTFTQTDINTPVNDSITNDHLNASVISGLTEVTPASGDKMMILDATDSALKKSDVKDIMATAVSITSAADAVAMTFDSSENATFAANIEVNGDITGQDDLYLDSDAAVVHLGEDGDVTLTHVADTGVLLNSTRQLQFGDSGTYIHQSADGVLDLVSDTEIEINATTIDVNGNLDVSGTVASAGVLTANAGVVVDNITIDGTEIDLSSGDLTLDVAGEINLDADGGKIRFKDGGTEHLRFVMDNAGVVQLYSAVQDADIKIQGNDGGSVIDALTFDMSDAGKATFNSGVTLGGHLDIAYSGGNITWGSNYPAIGNIPSSQATLIGNNIKAGASNNTIVRHAHGTDAGNFIGITYNKGVTFHTGITTTQNTEVAETTNERVRINTSGFVGINDTAPPRRLSITGEDGAYSGQNSGNSRTHLLLENNGSNYLEFINPAGNAAGIFFSNQTAINRGGIIFDSDTLYLQQGGYDRAVIRADGAFQTSDTNALVDFDSGGNRVRDGSLWGYTVRHEGTGSNPHGLIVYYAAASPDSTASYPFYFTDSTAARFYVNSAGNIWTSDHGMITSDETLKENIVDATPKLADIMKLKVRNFNWKKSYKPNTPEKMLGFIAQEFEEVFPSLIKQSDIAPRTSAKDDEDHVPNMKKSVVTGALIPALVKAMQEQQTLIEELQAEVKALKEA